MLHASHRRLHALIATTSTVALTSLALAAQLPQASASRAPNGQGCLAAVQPGSPFTARERTFAAAAATYGVPVAVAQGVSYLESRWDDHGAAPSTSGGFGPMHLTDLTPPPSNGRGKGGLIRSTGPAALHTALRAADLVGLSAQQVKVDDAANICAGVALLATYQHELGKPAGVHSPVAGWFDAVRRYSGSVSVVDSTTFARRVFTLIQSGATRTTNDGQRVTLAAAPSLRIPANRELPTAPVDCPEDLGCEWVPAPYSWYGRPDPGAYGNHDLADRPDSPEIDYIVIHDTEATYDTTLDLVQDPTYVSWNYTIRSDDGHVAQHLYANDVGWHAGNWYVNGHSIGIEHEGFAAQGATWYTESLYESSAELVSYLADEYGVTLDRAHIIGHDQVPGILKKYVKGMHWDPGPFWDWEHYFDLLGAPFGGGVVATPDNVKPGTVVTVAPTFATNYRHVSGCTAPGVPCKRQGTNFTYLHTEPRLGSPLVKDVGLHRHGYSTTDVADIGARAAAGQKLVVGDVATNFIGVWWLGELGWIWAPPGKSPLLLSKGQVVTVKAGADSAPVYGRAYPERDAYLPGVPYQRVSPLQYEIGKGQGYVLADDAITTDYYYATTYDDSAKNDHTDVVGKEGYEQIWLGHRIAYVKTADVRVQ